MSECADTVSTEMTSDTGTSLGSLAQEAWDSLTIEKLKGLASPLSAAIGVAEAAIQSIRKIYSSAAESQQKALEPVVKAAEGISASLKALSESKDVNPEARAVLERHLDALQECASTTERINNNNNNTALVSCLMVVSALIAAVLMLMAFLKSR